ncbi:sugar phosphate isomerase/epimerase [Paenibacillus filicis]|uniref:Sugar phosphate isomerase/epimerase n=1 Tax=Paenibacillus gyeongsangnamensis TaxID=3388067 RepID=A0ABT4QCC5_9BACL|nr:sugar phosphate isomerase/epimerase [Paenibacillus filicis]MCZ8514530.1 sugar phosphate isomerase/epimerase [Paenibacillus filicis]
MNKFMIGQYDRFDEKTYARDFRKGFQGVEACLFERDADIRRLVEEARNRDFRIGIHFPLRAGRSSLRDALFLAQDEDTRRGALRLIEEELEFLRPVRPAYVLFHYPKPVLLDDRVDWSRWRFADASEYVNESLYPQEVFLERSEQLFKWLTERSEAYRFTPVLEFDALNRYVYDSNAVPALLKKYHRIKLCLDTGRLYLQERLDPSFDARQVIRTYAPYAAVVHLWNVKITDRIEHNHHPAMPHLDPAEGWAPIEAYLTILREENPDVSVVFEHQSERIDDDELDACYRWVDQILYG